MCVYTCTGIHAFMSNVHTNVYISSIPMLWAWQIPLLTAIFWSLSPPKEWLFWWRVRCGTNRMGACTDVSWTEENFTSVEFLIILLSDLIKKCLPTLVIPSIKWVTSIVSNQLQGVWDDPPSRDFGQATFSPWSLSPVLSLGTPAVLLLTAVCFARRKGLRCAEQNGLVQDVGCGDSRVCSAC